MYISSLDNFSDDKQGETEKDEAKSDNANKNLPATLQDPSDAGVEERMLLTKPPSILAVLLILLRETCSTLARGSWWTLRTCGGYFRHHPFHAAFNVFLLMALWIVVQTGMRLHDELILAEISDATIDQVIEASTYTREYSPGEVSKLGTQSFLRVGAPIWAQRESVRAVLYEARKAGLPLVDQAVLLATVEVESGFNPMARAPTTTACGLFQFVRATGNRYDLDPRDCMDPWKNAAAGVRHYLDNYKKSVEPYVRYLHGPERVFTTFEKSYYLHHDGPNSSDPSNDVKAVVLLGTQFLFRAYHILQEEAHSEVRAPTFRERFEEEARHFLGAFIPQWLLNPAGDVY